MRNNKLQQLYLHSDSYIKHWKGLLSSVWSDMPFISATCGGHVCVELCFSYLQPKWSNKGLIRFHICHYIGTSFSICTSDVFSSHFIPIPPKFSSRLLTVLSPSSRYIPLFSPLLVPCHSSVANLLG